jgi:Fe-S cluster assembly protein SufD
MSLQTLTETLPSARAARLRQFLQLGWPHRKLEAWRHTDLTALAKRDFTLADLPVDDPDSPADAHDHFALLNSALATNEATGGNVSVDSQRHTRKVTVVQAGKSASLTLRRDGFVDGLRSHWHTLQLERDARAQVVWISDPQGKGHDLSRLTAHVAAGANLHVVVVHLGRATSRLELDIHLAGARGAAHLHVLSLPASGAFDLPVRVHHEAPHAVSRLALRAIGLAGTRCSLNGYVKVYEGAVKTDSEQHMASLLLSPKAEINAKPDLEIYNDDVKCAHGASFGQLDNTALFYLRSRGVDAVTARGMLTQAFAEQVLTEIEDGPLRAQLTDTLLARLAEAQS